MLNMRKKENNEVCVTRNKWKTKTIDNVRCEESTVIVKMCNWGKYSKVLVDILGLADEGDRNKILDISSGSDTMNFVIKKMSNFTLETRIEFSYDVCGATNNINLYYTKNTIML
jgi:hypothetical protein